MAQEQFSVRSELMQLIAKTGDDERRLIWMMMFGLLEQQEAGFRVIEQKLDSIISDDSVLRETVLNGHTATHHDDHDWVQERRKSGCDEVCNWSRAKMAEEKQAAQDAADIARAGRKAFVEQMARGAAIVMISALAGAMGAMHFMK